MKFTILRPNEAPYSQSIPLSAITSNDKIETLNTDTICSSCLIFKPDQSILNPDPHSYPYTADLDDKNCVWEEEEFVSHLKLVKKDELGFWSILEIETPPIKSGAKSNIVFEVHRKMVVPWYVCAGQYRCSNQYAPGLHMIIS